MSSHILGTSPGAAPPTSSGIQPIQFRSQFDHGPGSSPGTATSARSPLLPGGSQQRSVGFNTKLRTMGGGYGYGNYNAVDAGSQSSGLVKHSGAQPRGQPSAAGDMATTFCPKRWTHNCTSEGQNHDLAPSFLPPGREGEQVLVRYRTQAGGLGNSGDSLQANIVLGHEPKKLDAVTRKNSKRREILLRVEKLETDFYQVTTPQEEWLSTRMGIPQKGDLKRTLMENCPQEYDATTAAQRALEVKPTGGGGAFIKNSSGAAPVVENPFTFEVDHFSLVTQPQQIRGRVLHGPYLAADEDRHHEERRQMEERKEQHHLHQQGSNNPSFSSTVHFQHSGGQHGPGGRRTPSPIPTHSSGATTPVAGGGTGNSPDRTSPAPAGSGDDFRKDISSISVPAGELSPALQRTQAELRRRFAMIPRPYPNDCVSSSDDESDDEEPSEETIRRRKWRRDPDGLVNTHCDASDVDSGNLMASILSYLQSSTRFQRSRIVLTSLDISGTTLPNAPTSTSKVSPVLRHVIPLLENGGKKVTDSSPFSIRYFRADDCELTDDDAERLGTLIKFARSSELVFLSLRNNNFTDKGLRVFKKTVKFRPGLKYLDLSGNAEMQNEFHDLEVLNHRLKNNKEGISNLGFVRRMLN